MVTLWIHHLNCGLLSLCVFVTLVHKTVLLYVSLFGQLPVTVQQRYLVQFNEGVEPLEEGSCNKFLSYTIFNELSESTHL